MKWEVGSGSKYILMSANGEPNNGCAAGVIWKVLQSITSHETGSQDRKIENTEIEGGKVSLHQHLTVPLCSGIKEGTFIDIPVRQTKTGLVLRLHTYLLVIP